MGKIIQFETSGSNLGLSLREELRRQKLCYVDQIPTPTGPLVVSRLTWLNAWARAEVPETRLIARREPFNADPIYEYLPGKRVQLVQAVRVSISSIPQLIAAGPDEPQTTQILELHLVFGLQVSNVDGDVSLTIIFDGIEGLPDVPGLLGLKQRLAALFSARNIPLDIGALSGLGGKPTVANVGISFTGEPGATSAENDPAFGSTVVAIRVELGALPTSTGAWETFFTDLRSTLFMATGQKGVLLHESQIWALFTDESFITARTRDSVEENFKASGKFKLQGGIKAEWSAPDGRAIIWLDFHGTAVDACDLGALGSWDIGLHVEVPIELSVPFPPFMPVLSGQALPFQPGALQQQVTVNYSKNDWDTARCVLVMTALWPYLGPKLMEEDKLTWLQLVASLASGPLVSILILGEANTGGKAPSVGATCVRPDPAKDAFICTQPFDSSPFPLGGLPRLQDWLGRPDGLVLLGTMFWNERLGREFRLTSIETQPFKLDTPHFSCAQVGGPAGLAQITGHPEWFVAYAARVTLAFEPRALDHENAHRGISISRRNLIPPYICAARVRPEDDPLNVFAPYVTFDDSNPYVATVTVRVQVTAVPDAYFTDAHRYPCRLLIHTSHGTRMLTLPAITRASADDMKSLTLNAWARRVSVCKAKSRRYDPRWIIDPADMYRERHHWDVMVAGLRPGERVSLRDRGERVVSAIRANRQGTAWLRALLSPEAYGGRLSVGRAAPEPRFDRDGVDDASDVVLLDNYLAIDVKQTQLLLKSEIATDGPVLGVTPAMLGGRPGLLTVQPAGIAAYDLSRPEQPRLVLRSALNGMSGALARGEEILAWGERGVVSLQVAPEFGELDVAQASPRPAIAMASTGRQIFVITEGCLEIWDRGGRRDSVVAAPGARLLAATSSHLLVGTERGVTIYELGGREHLHPAGEYRHEGLARIVASELVGKDCEFLLEGPFRSELIDVSDPEHVAAIGEFQELPVLATFTLARDVLIERDQDMSVLRVYSVGATALM